MFKVSIIFTVRNAERYIFTSLNAALSIEYPSLEIVVVDDGSTDATSAICNSFSDARLRYIPMKSIGRSKALNIAIGGAAGDLIAINDADDISFPHRISHVVSIFEKETNVVLVGTKCQTTNMFGDVLPNCISDINENITDISPVRLHRNNVFVHSTVVFRKSAWEHVGGYDESLNMCIDYDFFLRVVPCGRILKSSIPTVLYYDNPTSHFKKLSPVSYLRTNLYIRERARKALKLPVATKIQNVLQYYQFFRIIIRKLF